MPKQQWGVPELKISMERIANFIYDRAKIIIAVVVILNLLALASFVNFKLDTNFLEFFTKGNPRTAEYNSLNEKYQIGETIAVLIEQEGCLLDEQQLQDVFWLQQSIENIDGIYRVQRLIPTEMRIGSATFQVDPTYISRHADLLEDFIRENYGSSQLLSSDESNAAIIVSIELDAPTADVLDSLEELVEVAEQKTSLQLSLAGNKIIERTFWHYLLRVLMFLPPCAMILVLLVFSTTLKKRSLSIMAVIPAGISALWTLGTVFWSGHGLNLITILCPIFVVVIGAADGLHYVSHFIDNLSRYPDRRTVTIKTFQMVGMPMFLTTITTIAGFASLMWSDVTAMRQLGLFASLGIAYAGLLSFFFLPAVFSRVKVSAKRETATESGLVKLIIRASRQRAMVVVVFMLIVVVSAVYIPRLGVESNQLMYFKDDSEIKQTFDKVEQDFGGALPLSAEIIADRGLLTLRDYQYAEDILDAERELERLPGIQSAFSLFDTISNLSQEMTGEQDYPENPAVVNNILHRLDEEDLETWYSDDGLRMMIKTDDLESLDVGSLDNFKAEHPGIRVITGMPVLFEEMNRLVVQSQTRSLGLAFALIFLMLLVTIRKLRAALVSLIPIAITVIAIMGFLSISGFNLNVVTVNMSAIAIGVGVDYSIHLVSGIYYFRERNHSNQESVELALATVSKPVLASALGLSIGISVMFFSPLVVHLQAAAVMWIAMMASSLAALLLVPLFYSRKG